MIKTDRAVSKEQPDALEGVSSYEGPVLVLYGAYDIFGDATEIVRRRLPRAAQVTLEGSGHLHWLQNPPAYANALHQFCRCAPASRLLDREFLAASFIHAFGKLDSFESVCAQHTGGGWRPVCGLADRDDGLRAVKI